MKLITVLFHMHMSSLALSDLNLNGITADDLCLAHYFLQNVLLFTLKHKQDLRLFI